ncbi:MAG: type II secretion system protein [Planctomycetota bacterium]|nr:type II secretion system protein [Planctomycetota bacterium]
MMRRPRNAQGGFTLLELTIAGSVFALIALALKDTVLLADRAQDAVVSRAEEHDDLRDVCRQLADELKGCQSSGMGIITLGNGCHEITFQEPIVVAGDDRWGIDEPGLDDNGEPREDWSLRYTVIDAGGRRLMRQVLDDKGDIQRSEVLLEALSEDAATPGFTLVPAGDIWQLSLALAGSHGLNHGKQLSFQFRARN